MLTEHFIASIGVPTRPTTNTASKDAGIFLHEFQPQTIQRSLFKKSATAPNCLAVSESHVFAAQADKGVVHVYSREKGNQEATVPFTERLTSICLACDDSVLVLGTTEGRIFLWETCTGRQISTTQAHLEPVTVLAVDATSNFLLSGSNDSTVNVWSIPALLSFSRTTDPAPLRTFMNHRAVITSLIVGHGASTCNFAVSASKDKTCLVWDYRTGNVLRTYLLPGVPTSLALDPADRAIFVGHEEGSIQYIDLFTSPNGNRDALQNGPGSTHAIQPPASACWRLSDASHGAVLALDVSWDGSMLISGHLSGSILAWDVARGSFMSTQTTVPLLGSVTNLFFLPIPGFHSDQRGSAVRISEIVKPKFGAFDNGESGTVPGNYSVNVQFPTHLHIAEKDQNAMFQQALTAPCFPQSLVDGGLSELAAWGSTAPSRAGADQENSEDFMVLDDSAAQNRKLSLEEENASLKLQLEALRRVQKTSFDKLERLSDEKRALLKREQDRSAKRSRPNANGKMGVDSEELEYSD